MIYKKVELRSTNSNCPILVDLLMGHVFIYIFLYFTFFSPLHQMLSVNDFYHHFASVFLSYNKHFEHAIQLSFFSSPHIVQGMFHNNVEVLRKDLKWWVLLPFNLDLYLCSSILKLHKWSYVMEPSGFWKEPVAF